MGLSCGMKTIKYILFVFNLLCVLCGIALLAIGIICITMRNDFNKLTDGLNIETVPGITIALGAVILIIAFIGCFGAIRDSYCMVLTYSIVVFLLLVAKIVIVVIVLVKRDDIQRDVGRVFERLWYERFRDTSVQVLINTVQQSFSCCGFEGPTDYFLVALPPSCCPESRTTCTRNDAFRNGCGSKMKNRIITNSNIIAFVVLGVTAIELIALIFSCCLANSIRHSQRGYMIMKI